MRAYSFRRVVEYARYHYVTQQRNYLSLLVTCMALPAFFGILGRDISVVVDMSVAIYIMGGLAFAVRTTNAMRERGVKILETTVPVSNEERMTFMLFNLMVFTPLSIIVTTILGMVITLPFNYTGPDLLEALDYMMRAYVMQWPLYVLQQIITSASLLINLLARRSLLVAYVGTFLGAIAFVMISGRVGIELLINNDAVQVNMLSFPEKLAEVVFIALPILFYALGYLALRRRQMRW